MADACLRLGHVGPPGTLTGVKTRYLLILSLVTAFVILGASAVWFFLAAT